MNRGLDPEEQRRLLSELFESTSDVLWMFSADWEEAIFINDAYEDVWGRPAAALEREPADFLEGVHPDDRGTVRAAMERISGGESAEMEFRVNPGEGYGRWVWTRGRPVYDDGEVVRVAGVSRDVTDRKRYEEELRRQNERLDEFASIVSHDLRSPLSVAQGRLRLAREECDCEAHLGPPGRRRRPDGIHRRRHAHPRQTGACRRPGPTWRSSNRSGSGPTPTASGTRWRTCSATR